MKDRFDELLPWYVNGSLDAEDREWVDRYLAQHPEARPELDWTRSLSTRLRDGAPAVAPTMGLERTMERIRGKRPTLADRVGAFLDSLGMRPAAAFAGLAIVAVQGGFILHLLDAAREQIESSAFYAENNAIAIDPELTKLNQATLVSIANVLRPDQRKRFDLFLKKHKSTYTVEARTHRDVPPPMPPIEWRSGVRTVGTAPRPFVVMTQDTCVYTQLELTAGHLELQQQELSRMRQVREENLGRLVERLRRTDEQREGRVRSDSEAIVVQGGTGYVSIQIHGALVTGLEDSAFQVVMRMPDQPKIFRHEIESPPGALNFEFSIKASGDLDSLVEAEMSRMREFQRHLVHEDSLLNARRRTPAAYPYSGDTVRSRRKF